MESWKCILPVAVQASLLDTVFNSCQNVQHCLETWSSWVHSSCFFVCLVQRCNNPHKTFFSYYDLTFAKVPHAEIPFQYLFFFSVQSQTCTQTQKPLCIASCFKYCDSTMCCPFSAWAKDLCSVSVDYQAPSLLYLLSTIPIHLTFH